MRSLVIFNRSELKQFCTSLRDFSTKTCVRTTNVALLDKVLKSFFFFSQDVTHKIVDAIGAIAGSSLEQTTWLRRNLEVKPSPKIMVDGNNVESDIEGDFIFIFYWK